MGEIPKVEDFNDKERARRFSQRVANVLNSLFNSQQLVRTGPDSFNLSPTLPDSGVTPGSYTSTDLTVNAKGIITAASSGGGGGGSGFEHSFTKPTIAGLTQVNTTGYTSSDESNGVFVRWSSALSVANSLVLSHVAVPGGNWNLDIRIQSLWLDGGLASGGAHLYESGTGKVTTFHTVGGAGATSLLKISNWNSVTSFNGDVKSVAFDGRPKWLRISYDGTNYTFWMSEDGFAWLQFGGNVAKASFFTTAADNAGFMLNHNDATALSAVLCMSLVCA